MSQKNQQVKDIHAIRQNFANKFKKHNEHKLAEKIETATSKELANEDKIEAFKQIWDEHKTDLDLLHEEIVTARNNGQRDKHSYNPIDYYGKNVNGSNTFRPLRVIDEIMEEYKFKNVIGGGFYVWVGDHWKELTEDNNIIGMEVDRRLQNESSQRKRNNVKDMIKNRDDVKVDRDEFQNPKYLIPFKNGVYDVNNDELIEHQPEQNFDFVYDVKFDPEIENNDVKDFISTIMPDSEKKQKKLREIAALCLAPWSINQKVPVFYGQGSNGKNQFVKIIQKMLGQESFHKTSAKTLQTDKFEMYSIVSNQMVFFDEFEDVTKPGQLKTLVGDENQTVREMHKESYTAKTSVYPIFAANELPNPPEESDGFYRRWEIIDFKVKFTPEKRDGNPMRIPIDKLEEKYMNQEALNAFATQIMEDLKELIDRNKFTDQQSTDEVRKIWKRKGNALYEFIDTFLEPGEQPDPHNNETDDWIIKDNLVDIINNYMEVHNNSPIKKHRLTRALSKHPDFSVVQNYRPRLESGDRVNAYAGIKFSTESGQAVRPYLDIYTRRGPVTRKQTNMGSWFDHVTRNKTAEVLMYLNRKDDFKANLFELVRKAKLEHEDLPYIKNCKYIEVQFNESNDHTYPVFKIDLQAVEDDPNITEFSRGTLHSANDFVKDYFESVSKDTQIEVQDLIEQAVEKGIDEDRAEKAIEQLKEEGRLYEPKPGKVQLI